HLFPRGCGSLCHRRAETTQRCLAEGENGGQRTRLCGENVRHQFDYQSIRGHHTSLESTSYTARWCRIEAGNGEINSENSFGLRGRWVYWQPHGKTPEAGRLLGAWRGSEIPALC